MTRKTDARGVRTDYVYDALNRVKNRNYSTPNGTPGTGLLANYQATPNVEYFYGTNAPAIGKLIKVESSVSTTEYTSFDILGRVKGHKQTTDGVGYETEYTYNLSGAMVEQRYPSGRVVKNVLDNNGDLSLVQSKKNSAYGFFTYANSFTYNPAGAVTSMQLGNGRWESTQFNSRLQPTQIGLGVTPGATNLLKLDYSYGTTNNNGNVLSQDITVKRSWQSDLVFNQTYTYDALNRIKAAEEKTGTTTNWRQTFVFDRYGNRNFDTTSGATTTLPENFDPNIYNPTVNTANNRFASGQGWAYDAVGNVITDPEGRTFAYDAENIQTEVEDSSSQTIGEYFLDGDGKRVKKYVPSTGEVTIFVYDAGAKRIGEYSTIVETQDPKVQYLTNDHLGSPRINTDQNGHLTSRTDYMPYGEEIVGLGNRTANENYVTDDVRQGFTGHQNDNETGLDYAQARMYAKNHGRFSGADPYNIVLESQAETDPKKARAKLLSYLLKAQQWNRYVYVANNPLIFVDPSGEILELTGTEEEKEAAYKRIEELCGEKCKGRLYREITSDGRTIVKYFDTKGGLAGNAGEIGVVLQDIINSDTLVQLQVTNKTSVVDATGKTVGLSEKGASTEIVGSKHIQIFISDSVSMAKISDSQWVLGAKDVDGNKLVNRPTVILAHELGHAWGGINDKTFDRFKNTYRVQIWERSNIRSENNKYSLIVENWQRSRLGLKHRANH